VDASLLTQNRLIGGSSIVEIAGEAKLIASFCFFFFLDRERLANVGWSCFYFSPTLRVEGQTLTNSGIPNRMESSSELIPSSAAKNWYMFLLAPYFLPIISPQVSAQYNRRPPALPKVGTCERVSLADRRATANTIPRSTTKSQHRFFPNSTSVHFAPQVSVQHSRGVSATQSTKPTNNTSKQHLIRARHTSFNISLLPYILALSRYSFPFTMSRYV
jgi:hypothetical protein